MSTGRSAKVIYEVDQDNPKAPSQEIWDQLTTEQRQRVVDALPSEFPVDEAAPPEGDFHQDACDGIRHVLRDFYERGGKNIYVGGNLPVYYPNETMFSPDVIAVRDVSLHKRHHWTVSNEERGLDLAMEVLYSGRRKKDLERNVIKYAALGILEYFIFDMRRSNLLGYRLNKSRGSYERLVPQGGFLSSEVLGLEMIVEKDSIRFSHAMAPLPNSKELIHRMQELLGTAIQQYEAAELRAEEEAKRAEEEAKRAEEESKRAEEEAKRAEEAANRANDMALRLEQALAEIERLRSRT